MGSSILLSPYAFLAYAGSIGAWVFVVYRRKSLDWASLSLSKLPEADRLVALRLLHGPIPDEISADQWIKEKKNRLVLVGFIATLAVAAPLILLSLSNNKAKDLAEFFGISEPRGRGRQESESDRESLTSQLGDDLTSQFSDDNLTTAGSEGSVESKDKRQSPEQGKDHPSPNEEAKAQILVGSAIEGVLERVNKRPGDKVAEGEPLAIVARADLETEFKNAEAAVERARSNELLLKNNAREQVKIAELEVKSAQAILDKAKLRLSRLEALAKKDEDVLAEQFLEDERAAVTACDSSLQLAKAKLEAAKLNQQFQNRKAEEEIALAQEQLRVAEAQAKRVVINAPASGVLRSIMSRGEAVSVLASRPVAIIELQGDSQAAPPPSPGH
jgi:biotin carboxyl carrier protein